MSKLNWEDAERAHRDMSDMLHLSWERNRTAYLQRRTRQILVDLVQDADELIEDRRVDLYELRFLLSSLEILEVSEAPPLLRCERPEGFGKHQLLSAFAIEGILLGKPLSLLVNWESFQFFVNTKNQLTNWKTRKDMFLTMVLTLNARQFAFSPGKPLALLHSQADEWRGLAKALELSNLSTLCAFLKCMLCLTNNGERERHKRKAEEDFAFDPTRMSKQVKCWCDDGEHCHLE